MTREEILRIMPQASQSTIDRNLSGSEIKGESTQNYADALGMNSQSTPGPDALYENSSQTPSAEPQQALCDEPMAEGKSKKGYALRSTIRIISYRRRLLDPDNLCPKAFIDSIRRAGLVADDNPQAIVLQVEQRKVKSKADERTVIEIWP
jgi:hypothetical protein